MYTLPRLYRRVLRRDDHRAALLRDRRRLRRGWSLWKLIVWARRAGAQQRQQHSRQHHDARSLHQRRSFSNYRLTTDSGSRAGVFSRGQDLRDVIAKLVRACTPLGDWERETRSTTEPAACSAVVFGVISGCRQTPHEMNASQLRRICGRLARDPRSRYPFICCRTMACGFLPIVPMTETNWPGNWSITISRWLNDYQWGLILLGSRY